MKYTWLSLIFLQTGSADVLETQDNATQAISSEPISNKTLFLLETKASYFFFSNSKMNKVYQNGGFQLQLSGSYPIWKILQLYSSIGYSHAWGRSISFHQRSSIEQLSIDLGLKPVFTINSFAKYYLALGPRYFYMHQQNHSSYVSSTINKSGAGLFTNTGFNISPCPHLIIDIFGEYTYEPINITSSRANVYGTKTQLSFFSFGAGIGYNF